MKGPAAPRVVLVTGTDTGVGKTVVGFGLARRLAESGRRVVAVKPVESGCGERVAQTEDGALLARATGQAGPAAALVRLRAPLAPPAAADRQGVSLDLDELVREMEGLARGCDVLLVEGAGGLLSPLTWSASALDLAVALGAGAIVVAPDRLGSLNHVLLTIRALESAAVPVLGAVLVAPETADESTGTNAASLRRAGASVRIATLGRLADIEAAPGAVEAVARWLEA